MSNEVSNLEHPPELSQTLWQFLPWLGTVVAGALAWLARTLLATQEKRIAQLEKVCEVQQSAIDECTKDRETLRIEVKGLSKDLEHLKERLA